MYKDYNKYELYIFPLEERKNDKMKFNITTKHNIFIGLVRGAWKEPSCAHRYHTLCARRTLGSSLQTTSRIFPDPKVSVSPARAHARACKMPLTMHLYAVIFEQIAVLAQKRVVGSVVGLLTPFLSLAG